METRIEVQSMEIIEGRGVLKGVADVLIGELLVKGLRLIEREGQGFRVSMPAQKRRAEDGSIEWRPVVVVMFEGLKRRIENAILEAYRKKVSGS